MRTIKVTIKEKIALITLDRGRSNAINLEMLTDLKEIFQSIDKDDSVSGIILTGRETVFSAGFDLVELFDYSENDIKSFYEQYFLLISILVTFKKPFVVAINGHAPGAATVFSLCGDYRVMADGNYTIGLNELALGIIIPEGLFQLYGNCIGRSKANSYLLEGKLMNPAEALSIGLVNQVFSHDTLTMPAVRQMQKYLQFNKVIWQESKLNIRRNLIFAVQPHQPELIKKILDEWWAPYNRSILHTIIQNFRGI